MFNALLIGHKILIYKLMRMVDAVVEIAERFTFYGVLGNLVTYFTNVLGQTISTAAKNVNTWVGVSMILPIFGAAVADSYLGRFKTIIIASVIYLLVGPSFSFSYPEMNK